tara:strand:+ start:5830 stop:7626 length:1797 start_codon:yes stop_codon:yes gene_type:complete
LKWGVRAKLFAISVGLIACVLLISAVFLEAKLRTWLELELRQELVEKSEMVRESVVLGLEAGESWDDLADRMGNAAQARVTLIHRDGMVLGDSIWTPAQVSTAPNHGDRTEIQQVREESDSRLVGHSTRYSDSAQKDLMYVALPAVMGATVGFVRLSVPLEEIDGLIWRLRSFLLTAALLGLLAAFFLSGVASHMMAASLRRLVVAARSLSKGETRVPIPVEGGDELATLTKSINRMGNTLRRQLEEMKAEKKQFNTVLNRMQVGVIALNEENKIELVNKFAKDWLGLPDLEIGQPQEGLACVSEVLQSVEEVKKNPETVIELTVEGVAQRKLQVQILRQKNNNGVVMAIHDVTRLRHLERIRRDFVANVSHELRTPVSVVLANSEMLLDGAMDDPVMGQRFLRAINSNAHRLSLLLNDLLDISKMEADKMDLEPCVIQVEDEIQKALEGLAAKVAEKKHEVELIVAAELKAFVDPSVLEQILVNYIENAIKYTPDEGKIKIDAQLVADRIRISVADNGPGIEEKHHQRIFERFYRVDKGRSKYMGGTGLGLAIVKHLARSSGGDVGVSRSEMGGSMFWVTLPQPKSVPSEAQETPAS